MGASRRRPLRGSGGDRRDLEAPGIEPGSEAAFHATSTSVVPVLISPQPRPGTRLGYGQPRCMSRPAPRRHRAARLLALTSGPSPAAEETVDVRPKPELFSSLLLTQRGREVRYSHVYFSRFYEPGARLAFARPTTPSKPVRPHGTQLSEISVLDQAYNAGDIATTPAPFGGELVVSTTWFPF